MDTRQYRLRARVDLRPLCYQGAPDIKLCFCDDVVYSGGLKQPQSFVVDRMLPAGTVSISLEFRNKGDRDTNIETGQDKAVIIDRIQFNDISDPKFVWAGIYRPRYPDHMLDMPAELTNIDYLGWNGVWTLNFDIPVFTWIHGVQQMGWIFD